MVSPAMNVTHTVEPIHAATASRCTNATPCAGRYPTPLAVATTAAVMASARTQFLFAADGTSMSPCTSPVTAAARTIVEVRRSARGLWVDDGRVLVECWIKDNVSLHTVYIPSNPHCRHVERGLQPVRDTSCGFCRYSAWRVTLSGS